MTVTMMIVMLLLGIFRVGLRTWEKGNQAVEGQQRIRRVLDRLKRQLTAAVPIVYPDMKTPTFRFEGFPDAIRFMSDFSLISGRKKGRIFVEYRVNEHTDGRKELVFREIPLPLLKSKKGVKREEMKYIRLLDSMKNFSFTYLVGNKKNALDLVWENTCEASTGCKWPIAVKIILHLNSGDDSTFLMVRFPPSLQ